jgi:23S rRNA (guanosine2251-2'-O)-methyltransferase
MSRKSIYLILDNIRSRENVGSIFRTADAAGVAKIYLCGITPQPPHSKIAKASLGAENFVPYEYIRNTWRIVTKLKKSGITVIALEQARDSVDVFKLRTMNHEPLALVVGNEVNGISSKILKHCDKKVFIPMHGRKESLNVSVATGVALYQLILVV